MFLRACLGPRRSPCPPWHSPPPPPPREQLLAWNSFYWVFHLLLQTEGDRTLSWVFGAKIHSSFILFVWGFLSTECVPSEPDPFSALCVWFAHSLLIMTDRLIPGTLVGVYVWLGSSRTFSQLHWLPLLSLSGCSSVPTRRAHRLIYVAFLLGPWADGYQEDHARGRRLTEGSWLQTGADPEEAGSFFKWLVYQSTLSGSLPQPHGEASCPHVPPRSPTKSQQVFLMSVPNTGVQRYRKY